MSTTNKEDSIESSDFDFCTPNYLNDPVEKAYYEENMSSSSESLIIIDSTNILLNTVEIKTEIEEEIPNARSGEVEHLPKISTGQKTYQTHLSTLSKTTINIRNNIQQSQPKYSTNKSIYHLPKSISKNDFYKHKYLSKYRNITSARKNYSTHTTSTNISNSHKSSLIPRKKYGHTLKRQIKPNIKSSTKAKSALKRSLKCSDILKSQQMLSVRKSFEDNRNTTDYNPKDNDENVSWETIKEISSQPAIRVFEQTNNQIANNNLSDFDAIRLKTIGSDDGIWDVDETCSKEVTIIQGYNTSVPVANIMPQGKRDSIIQKITVNISENECTHIANTIRSEERQVSVSEYIENITSSPDKENNLLTADKTTVIKINESPKVKRYSYLSKSKLKEIQNKLSEFRTKIPKIAAKQIDIPVFKYDWNFEQRFNLTRKDLCPTSIILNTMDISHQTGYNIEYPNGINFPLDLSKNGSKSSDNQLYSLISMMNKHDIPSDENNTQFKNFDCDTDFQMQTDKVCLVQVQDVRMNQNENEAKKLNLINTNEVDMEIEETHKDVSVMVNMSTENGINENVINEDEQKYSEVHAQASDEPKKSTEFPKSVMNMVEDKVDGIKMADKDKNIGDNKHTKKVIETIVLDILEELPAIQVMQKKYFKDSINYIIEEVINRYSEKTNEPQMEVVKEKMPEVQKTVQRVTKGSKPKIVKRSIARKNNGCRKISALEKKTTVINLDKKIQKESTDKNTKAVMQNELNITNKKSSQVTSNNKIYESIEHLTQTIKATLEEFGRLHNSQKPDKAVQQENINDNNSPDLFTDTNLSVISNKFSATSTPFHSSHYTTECLKGLGIMQKKLNQISKNNSDMKNNASDEVNAIVPITTHIGKYTKQATLTQTFNLQKNINPNNKITTVPLNDKDTTNKENEPLNNNGAPELDDLYIDMDLEQMQSFADNSNIDDLAAILAKVEEWKNASDPWINEVQYDEPRIFNPNYLIMFDSSQASATQFPSNQEALKKRY